MLTSLRAPPRMLALPTLCREYSGVTYVSRPACDAESKLTEVRFNFAPRTPGPCLVPAQNHANALDYRPAIEADILRALVPVIIDCLRDFFGEHSLILLV